MSISLNTLKLHNDRLDELLKKLEDNFGWKPIHPKEPIESIMYRAGQASVIDYIKSIRDMDVHNTLNIEYNNIITKLYSDRHSDHIETVNNL